MDEIEVSVYCLAFNHEKYIRDALEGFVKQKTTFKFEVIVHDDASTDNTASIIKEYESKFPELIKGIYQKENQYSQGVDILGKYIYPKIQGKYIAICEGDDYWIDQNKLQKQFDALEKHPECDMCAHGSKWFDCSKNREAKIFPTISKERVLTVEEVIYGEGGFLPTASLFFRKGILLNPMHFQKIWNIDYSLQIRGALRGGIYYIPDIMSFYRWNTGGSWTARNSDLESQMALDKKRKEMLNELNNETFEQYKEIIEKRLKKNKFNELILRQEFRTVIRKENKCFIQELTPAEQAKLYIKAYFPLIGRLNSLIKRRKR